MVCMDSVHRSLSAFCIVHVCDDEALGERYKIVGKFDNKSMGVPARDAHIFFTKGKDVLCTN